MQWVIKLHPEIIMKSRSLRRRYTHLLERNIRILLREIDPHIIVKNEWDRLSVITSNTERNSIAALISQLKRVPGVERIHEVIDFSFVTLDDIYQQVHREFSHLLENKTFAVRAKRIGEHDFSSMDLAKYVGGGLNQNIHSSKVKLKQPDVEIMLEVRQQNCALVKHQYLGLGGFPLPSQEDVLSLISGGYDSTVASYLMMRKGARTHFCFFNLGGNAHQIAVQEVAYYIWKRFSYSHRVKFISVDFQPIIAEILETVDDGVMGVVLKRMMMRAAGAVADKMQVQALVTGESLGQVSSQTLTNLALIDQAVPHLILRPLVQEDKAEIIATSRKIGTEEFAQAIPEYCAVISKKPNVKPRREVIEAAEQQFDFSLLDEVIAQATVQDIKTLATTSSSSMPTISEVEVLTSQTIIDVRSPQEEDETPLILSQTVIHIPFYKLETIFKKLPQDKEYLFYCERGVMSKLQALLFAEQGYKNVGIYKPK